MFVDANSPGAANGVSINGAALLGDLVFLGGQGYGAFFGGPGSTSVTGGAGNDLLIGSNGANVFNAGAGNDTLIGGSGNDVLNGGVGNDTLIGRLGADTMNGGAGADVFDYSSWGDGADASPIVITNGAIGTNLADTLVSFQASSDTINLNSFAFGYYGTASVANRAVKNFTSSVAVNNTFFGNAGVVVEYVGKGKSAAARVYIDANHDGSLDNGDMLIQLTGVARNSITANTFKF